PSSRTSKGVRAVDALPSSSARTGRLAAAAAAFGFVGVATFQFALAAGAPWGQAAWGGAQANLPTTLRLASGIAVAVYAAASLIVLGRAGYWGRGSFSALFRLGTWFLAFAMALGALLNFASQSRWENYLWGPVALTLAILCAVVARSPTSTAGSAAAAGGLGNDYPND
ncbi:MAG: hypothetical protein ACRDTR_22255, partial [Rubrobacter sp.]